MRGGGGENVFLIEVSERKIRSHLLSFVKQQRVTVLGKT